MAAVVVKQNWVRRFEHGVLRGVSLVFSMAGAYAIRLFFAPLDVIDRFEMVITWLVALGFGVLGYFVSRGLVHRMMNGERIWAYAPICLVVELVEIACNYVLAAETVHSAVWLAKVPASQQPLLTTATYVVLSVIPLVSLLLAVVDMDLERSKSAVGAPKVPVSTGRPQGAVPRTDASRPQNGAAAPGRTPPVTPRVQNEADKKAQEAKRAGFWQRFNQGQGRQGPQKQYAANGNGAAPAQDFLHDPEKFAEVV